MFPIRLLSPLIAIGVAGYYFLPETTGNILSLTKRYESKVPIIWNTHQKITNEVETLKKETVKEVEKVSEKLGTSSSPSSQIK